MIGVLQVIFEMCLSSAVSGRTDDRRNRDLIFYTLEAIKGGENMKLVIHQLDNADIDHFSLY